MLTREEKIKNLKTILNQNVISLEDKANFIAGD